MEAQEYLASSTCSDYLRKAERRLAEETERTSNYLDPSSEPKVTRVVENELVRKQVLACPAFHSLFSQLLHRPSILPVNVRLRTDPAARPCHDG